MTTEIQVVMDTNVLVSALLRPRSLPRRALDLAIARGCLLMSAESIGELSTVLARPKFQKYVTEAQRLEFLAALISVSRLVEVTEPVQVCRDPKDDQFLALARAGTATHLVSGDEDLLTLVQFGPTRILTPADFVQEFP